MATATVDIDDLGGGEPDEPVGLSLAAGFDTGSAQRWSDLVDAVMSRGGRDVAAGAGVAMLTRRTLDDLELRPLYSAEDVTDAPPSPGAPARGGWDVRVRLVEPDPTAAAVQALAELDTGASSLWVTVGQGGSDPADLATVLADVLLDLAPVVLDGADDVAAQTFLGLIAARGITDPLGNLGLDPIAQRARTGAGPEPGSVLPLATAATGYPRLRALVVDATVVHEAGGSDAQQIGWSLAHGLAYLRVLTEGGVDVTTAARLLEFRYAASPDQFATIALLRAARRAWGRVAEVCGVASDGPGQAQHAVTSTLTWTRRDPYTNLLRGTLTAFAAGVGGADAVTVAPFDSALRPPASFSRRIARNTQTLLIAESHVAEVVDPAGGSWYVETRTAELAAAAWTFFQELESGGGAVGALDSGLLAERLAGVADRRRAAIATRRTPLTGVSEFADPHERLLPGTAPPDPPRSAGLPRIRLAAPFEQLRDRADARPTRPRVFLASLGPVSGHTARVQFARNLLQAGGIEAPDAGPTDDVPALAAAFSAAGTPVAVLCGSDLLYAERAAETAAALRRAGACMVLLAGRASEPPVAGIDGYLSVGGDALAALDLVWSGLGLKAQR